MRTRFTDLRYGVIGVVVRIRRLWTRRRSRALSGSRSTSHNVSVIGSFAVHDVQVHHSDERYSP